MNAHPTDPAADDPAADPPTFDYDPGYPQTYQRDYDNAYDRVTARDIADLLHQFTELHGSTRDGIANIDPAERAAFLSHKAELFTRIARGAERTGVDDYSRQVRQMAADARAAAQQARLQLPQQRVGPDHRRTPGLPPATDGARSEENSGASSG
ncbi:hypothetical protein [Pseudonocardia sp.]|uniref:hypothetical protein n=1 Tax=Pseudonocardia sp. TaxID=60912 RepID=UPI0026280230|nr:hypothetical protein [Pseudonocardia sp.]